MTAPAGRLTRLTVSGARARADLAVASDQPVGLLLPGLVAMVGAAGPGGHRLTTADGAVLDPDRSLQDSAVPDGAIVRLDTVAEAPPAPILHDVADHVADDAGARPGRFDARARAAVATAVAVLAAVGAAAVAGPVAGYAPLLAAGVAGLLAGAAVAAAPRHRAAGLAVALAGAAVAGAGCALAPGTAAARWGFAVLLAAVAIGLLGAVTGHRRAALLGAGTLAAHLALWVGLGAARLSPAQCGAVAAVVAIALLGLLPRVAVTASGLAGLDDRHAADEPVPRRAAQAAVDAAHRGLALATVAAAGSAALAGALLAGGASPWALVLAGLLAVVLLLRLRAFPLTVEVAALLGAAAVAAGALLRTWLRLVPGQWWEAAAAVLAVAAIAVVVLAHRPSAHGRARARQVADRLESLAVVASVPVAVGVFGVYERLLAAF